MAIIFDISSQSEHNFVVSFIESVTYKFFNYNCSSYKPINV